MSSQQNHASSSKTGFAGGLRMGVLLGLVVLLLSLAAIRWSANRLSDAPAQRSDAPEQHSGAPSFDAAPPSIEPPAVVPAPPPPIQPRYAKFGKEWASPDARHIANWALHSGDNENKAVVIVDKRYARVFVFSPEGRLISTAPALLGSAVGDHTVPGVGDKPLSQVLPEERTTPAGRFVAEPGVNHKGEDIVWVDYDAAVSMHRVRPNVKAERRLQRLASATPEDNRISFGCINLPIAFYEQVLSPTVNRTGAVVYVLPEVQSAQALFGSYNVPINTLVAQR